MLVEVGIERDGERHVREMLHEAASVDRHVALVCDVGLDFQQADDDLGRQVELEGARADTPRRRDAGDDVALARTKDRPPFFEDDRSTR
jgi:hypothetical protein